MTRDWHWRLETLGHRLGRNTVYSRVWVGRVAVPGPFILKGLLFCYAAFKSGIRPSPPNRPRHSRR